MNKSVSYLAKWSAIALAFSCSGCLVLPDSAAVFGDSEEPVKEKLPETKKPLTKYAKTCYADSLTQREVSEVTDNSTELEAKGDELAKQGKHEQAITKYNEVATAWLNEMMVESSMSYQSIDTEKFMGGENNALQKLAKLLFKIGQSYTQLGRYENAIDCFNESLKFGIDSPNDAIVYLNRCDVYLRIGDKSEAIIDCQESASLFQQYKLPAYQKMALKKLQIAKK